MQERRPLLGGVILAAQSEPASAAAWSTGPEGEERAGAGLDRIASSSVRVLHDRRIPGGRTNIDHLVVTGAGVYVIDTKSDNGRVEHRDGRLWVAGRNRSQLVEGMARRVGAVRQVLRDGTPLFPVLCFVDADWALITRPFTITDTLVCWPRALRQRIQAGKPGEPLAVATVAARLATGLSPA